MNDLERNTNLFLNECTDFFNLDHEEGEIIFEGTAYLSLLIDKLFACRFLYDCIDKGIALHKEILNGNINELAKKIDFEDVDKIKNNFKEIIENKDLISILAYEFFINFLDSISREILSKNVYLLKEMKDVNYKTFELIDRVTNDPHIIIEELINILISDSRDGGSLKTRSEFWIKFLEKSLKFRLKEIDKAFWESFSIRRNASSHKNAKIQWETIMIDISNKDISLWLYSLIFLAHRIDEGLINLYNLDFEPIKYSFSGKPVYNLNTLKI